MRRIADNITNIYFGKFAHPCAFDYRCNDKTAVFVKYRVGCDEFMCSKHFYSIESFRTWLNKLEAWSKGE